MESHSAEAVDPHQWRLATEALAWVRTLSECALFGAVDVTFWALELIGRHSAPPSNVLTFCVLS